MTAHVTNAVRAAVWHPSCTLPLQLRAFLCCLAELADWHTGRGLSGQARIAAAMGVSDRTVRALRAELEALGDASPVTVTWTHRGRAGGTGRTSDSYQLSVRTKAQPEAYEPQPEALGTSTGSRLPPITGVSRQGLTPVNIEKQKLGAGPSAGAEPAREEREGPLTRLPPGWAPTAAGAALAASLGLDGLQVADAFRRYHEARGSLRYSWAAAWEEWVTNAARWRDQKHADKLSRTAAAAEALREAAAAARVTTAKGARVVCGRGNRALLMAVARVLRVRLSGVTWSSQQCAAVDAVLAARSEKLQPPTVDL